MMKITISFVAALTLSLTYAFARPIATDPAIKDGWIQHVAVCTLPPKADPKALGNASRGIAFSACPDPPAGQNLASVAITADSGLEEQFFAAGELDPYWLKFYLSPLVPGFPVDCWKAPAVGCAKPPDAPMAKPAAPAPAEDVAAPAPAPAVAKMVPAKQAAPPSDAQLLPLVRRSRGAEDALLYGLA